MMQEQPVFQIGDSVVVKEGFKDPDNGTVEIGGWQGRIAEIDRDDEKNPLFLVEWDGPTLRGLSPPYIVETLMAELDYTAMYLSPEVLRPAEPRDTLEETETALAEVSANFIGQILPPATRQALAEYTQVREGLRAVYDEAMETVAHEDIDRAAKQLGILRSGNVLSLDSEDELGVLMDFTLYELRRDGIPIIQWYLRNNPAPKRNNPAPKKESGLGATIASAFGSLLNKEKKAPHIDIARLGEAVRGSFTSLFKVDDFTPEGLLLVDLLDSKRPSYQLIDIGLLATAEPRLLIFSRLLPFPEYHITSGVSFCYPPHRQEQLLRSYRSAIKDKRGHRVNVERFRYFHRANRRFGLEMVFE